MKYDVKHELYYWNKPGQRKYQILEDNHNTYFAVHNVENIILPDCVLEYSQQCNDIITILEQGSWIVTEYLQDYQPIIIRGSCDFYKEMRVKEYNNFFQSKTNCKNYYKRIVKEHIGLIESTGWHFNDRSGTNVMVDKNYTDFKIIDVMSLQPVTESQTFTVTEFFYPSKRKKALAHKYGMIIPDIKDIQQLTYELT